jgi:hypothetical protein
MARGTQLIFMRQMLKAELGQTLAAGAAIQGDARLNQLLSNKQQWLSSEYDWPFLEHRWDLTVGPSVRYLPLPTIMNGPAATQTQINFERPVIVEVLFNTKWQDVIYGIGADEFNTRNSDIGEAEDPIQRWDFSTNIDEPTAPNQVEMWPIPITQQTVRFTGQRVLLPLVADTDTADLDDMLLVYFVAADLAREKDDSSAQIKLELATGRLRQIRQVYPHRYVRTILGRPDFDKWDRRQRRLVPIIIVR